MLKASILSGISKIFLKAYHARKVDVIEFDAVTFNKLRERPKLDKGDILLTSAGTIGEMFLLIFEPHNIEFQRNVAIIKPNNDYVNSYFLYLQTQNTQIKNLAHGTVKQCIFISDLKGYNFTLPDKNTISCTTP